MTMVPADDQFESRVRASFARQSIMGLLGAEMTRVEPGICQIELAYREDLCQQHGFFHAGVVATIVDSAGGYAAYSLFAATESVLTTEYKLNLLAPADGDKLVATGRVVKPGRTLTTCDLEVEVWKHGRSKLCAKGLQTLIRIPDRPDIAQSG